MSAPPPKHIRRRQEMGSMWCPSNWTPQRPPFQKAYGLIGRLLLYTRFVTLSPLRWLMAFEKKTEWPESVNANNNKFIEIGQNARMLRPFHLRTEHFVQLWISTVCELIRRI